eukprot:m.226026 g.226026  ORF g.226026 m.226026 type:complete len:332 (+) comp15162_c0_seq1:529-1524(+)
MSVWDQLGGKYTVPSIVPDTVEQMTPEETITKAPRRQTAAKIQPQSIQRPFRGEVPVTIHPKSSVIPTSERQCFLSACSVWAYRTLWPWPTASCCHSVNDKIYFLPGSSPEDALQTVFASAKFGADSLKFKAIVKASADKFTIEVTLLSGVDRATFIDLSLHESLDGSRIADGVYLKATARPTTALSMCLPFATCCCLIDNYVCCGQGEDDVHMFLLALRKDLKKHIQVNSTNSAEVSRTPTATGPESLAPVQESAFVSMAPNPSYNVKPVVASFTVEEDGQDDQDAPISAHGGYGVPVNASDNVYGVAVMESGEAETHNVYGAPLSTSEF